MAVLVGILVLLVVLLALQRPLRYYIRFRRLELSIPGPPSLPVLGNALDFFGVTEETVLPMLWRIWDYRWGLSRFSLLGRLIVIVSDAEDMEKVAKRRDLQDKARFFYEFIEYISRRGLITVNGAQHRSHRRALQPAFHQNVLDRYMDVFSEEAVGFVRRVPPHQEHDVMDNLRTLAARAFMRTALVCEVEGEFEEQVPQFCEAIDLFTRSVNERSFQPLLWPNSVYKLTKIGRVLRKRRNLMDTFSSKIIARRRAVLQQRQADGVEDDEDYIKQRRTLIDILVDPKSKTSDGKLVEMSDLEVRDEFKTFMAAAVETTVASLGWVIKVLSVRPEIQERVHAEIVEEVAGKEELTTADISELRYTEQVIKETMRLLPPVPFTARMVKEDTEFSGYQLPADTTMVLNIIGCHRDPRHWPDPLRFDPDRFTPEQCAKRHPHAYQPFSAGSRNCIGSRYAMMVMKTLLAKLLAQYRVDPVDDGHTDPVDFPMTFDVSSRMLGGVRVVLTPRHACAA